MYRAQRAHLQVIATAGNTTLFKKSQGWQAIDSTVLDLTGPRFEHQTSSSRDKHVIFVHLAGNFYIKRRVKAKSMGVSKVRAIVLN